MPPGPGRARSGAGATGNGTAKRVADGRGAGADGDPDGVAGVGGEPGSDVRIAPASAAGERFDAVAATLFAEHSRSRLQRWIADGRLTVDGAARRAKSRLVGGERLGLALAPDALADLAAADWGEGAGSVAAEPVDFAVAHEDASIVVVDKRAGLVMHPAPGHARGTLMNGLLHRYPELARVPRAGIVHRLDRDTSGLCVVARTPEAHTALVRALASREIGREYAAVAIGDPPASGAVDAPIGRDARDRKRMAVAAGGKPALTRFEVRERLGGAALLDVRLETGRTHQIRVHLTHLGHPLVGDPVYRDGRRRGVAFPKGGAGRAVVDGFGRQALHARRLSLAHPDGGAVVAFESAWPPDLERLVEALREAAARDGRADS